LPQGVNIPKFYEQLLCSYFGNKKLQSQAATREKLRKALTHKKGARKMLMKLTGADPKKLFSSLTKNFSVFCC